MKRHSIYRELVGTGGETCRERGKGGGGGWQSEHVVHIAVIYEIYR